MAVPRNGDQIVLGQGFRTRHQLDMCSPEFVGAAGAFHQFGGAPGDIAADKGAMPEDVAQAFAEATADLDEFLVRCAAVGAGVAAIFNQRDLGVRRAEYVVPTLVHRAVEPTGLVRFGHRTSRLPTFRLRSRCLACQDATVCFPASIVVGV